ncbi:MAG: phosphoribosylglycinamide formyltransferase [Leptospira sp.]|nr:phosphoribosylglycinamide formyltransferase [Leptospira sp.]
MASVFQKNSLKRVVFLASGRGSNFEAVAKKIRGKKLSCLPVGLVSDNREAKCLQLARSFGIPSFLIDYKSFDNKKDFHNALLDKVDSLEPDLIVTAGFMRLLSPEFVRAYKQKIINIHPSLLPAFPGMNSQKQAIEYGAKFSGCTAHFIDEGVDTGPIILQSVVKIDDTTTEVELSRAILKEEHKILAQAIELFLKDQLKIEGRKVKKLQ